jgi:hypothetical protein
MIKLHNKEINTIFVKKERNQYYNFHLVYFIMQLRAWEGMGGFFSSWNYFIFNLCHFQCDSFTINEVFQHFSNEVH